MTDWVNYRDEALRVKEIHKFRQEDRCFGLDVQNALFFEMNQTTWDVLETYPDLEKLTPRYDTDELNQTLDSLKQNRFLTAAPPVDEPPVHQTIPVTGIGLIIHGPGEEVMTLPVIHRAIDILLQQSGDADTCRLVFIADNPDESLETIDSAVNYAQTRGKEYNKIITIGLRTQSFPFSSRFTCFVADNEISIEVQYHPETFNIEDIDPQVTAPILKQTVVVVPLDSTVDTDVHNLMQNLFTAGLKLVYLDYLCSRCMGGAAGSSPLIPTAGILDKSVNAIPFIETVMTSSKARYGCRAGIDYITVSPDGNIYPCHHAARSREQAMGNVVHGIDAGVREENIRQSIENKPQCVRCGVRYFCGGGTKITNENDNTFPCNLQQELVQSALLTYNRAGLRSKTGIINIHKQLVNTMPYRLAPAVKKPAQMTQRRLKVNGSSMRPFIKPGDYVEIQPFDAPKVGVGDIVCFGKPVTCHRVIRKTRKNNRLYVIEKGDNQLTGTHVPAGEISGRVAAIRKGDRTLNIRSPWWLLLNRFIAAVSLSVHIAGTVLKRIKKQTSKHKREANHANQSLPPPASVPGVGRSFPSPHP